MIGCLCYFIDMQAEQQDKDASLLSRVSSCPLPDTPQQEAPQLVLPKLKIVDSSSKPKPSTPGAAAAGEAAAAGPGQCPGWFFNCRCELPSTCLVTATAAAVCCTISQDSCFGLTYFGDNLNSSCRW
jgi:hypothetical protein